MVAEQTLLLKMGRWLGGGEGRWEWDVRELALTSFAAYNVFENRCKYTQRAEREGLMVNKLAETMLYLAQRCQEDAAFGSTKLNKILFIIDFLSFGAWGESITDATYIHWDRGPIPRERPSAEQELLQSGRARIVTSVYFGYEQKKLRAMDEADLGWLTAVRRQFVDQVIDHVDEMNATQLSEWSHRLLPWRYTKQGEVIPYSAVFCLSKVEPTLEDIEWGVATIKSLREQGLWQMSRAS